MPVVANSAPSGPSQQVLGWLEARGVDYELREHSPAETARATAHDCGVQPTEYAKVVGVVTRDGRRAMLVVGADDCVDLDRAAWALAVNHVRLLREEELEALAPGCDPGALPAIPLGGRIAICADSALRESDRIAFPAGSHRLTVTIRRSEWERAADVEYCPLAETRPIRPECVEWY